MATWTDVFSLVITISIIGGIIYGVIFIVNLVNEGLSSTKESLKSRGLEISPTGVSVKTSQRFTREDQIDATQRHIVAAIGASSFRKGEAPQINEEGAPLMTRRSSSKSETSLTSPKFGNEEGTEKKKKRGLFGNK